MAVPKLARSRAATPEPGSEPTAKFRSVGQDCLANGPSKTHRRDEGVFSNFSGNFISLNGKVFNWCYR
jgi:hypothetical protein